MTSISSRFRAEQKSRKKQPTNSISSRFRAEGGRTAPPAVYRRPTPLLKKLAYAARDEIIDITEPGPLSQISPIANLLGNLFVRPIVEPIQRWAQAETPEKKYKVFEETARGLVRPYVDPITSFQEAPITTAVAWAAPLLGPKIARRLRTTGIAETPRVGRAPKVTKAPPSIETPPAEIIAKLKPRELTKLKGILEESIANGRGTPEIEARLAEVNIRLRAPKKTVPILQESQVTPARPTVPEAVAPAPEPAPVAEPVAQPKPRAARLETAIEEAIRTTEAIESEYAYGGPTQKQASRISAAINRVAKKYNIDPVELRNQVLWEAKPTPEVEVPRGAELLRQLEEEPAPAPAKPTTKRTGLIPLMEEAQKYPDFESFSRDFSLEIKHGRYWHITDDPRFGIDPQRGPRDMSSLGAGVMTPSQLMTTSHLEYWLTEYPGRKYVAEIDLSALSPREYYQVNRGFGNEFVLTPEGTTKARVVKVYTREGALRADRAYQKLLPQSKEELQHLYEQAHGRVEPPTPPTMPVAAPRIGVEPGVAAKPTIITSAAKTLRLGENELLTNMRQSPELVRQGLEQAGWKGRFADLQVAVRKPPELVEELAAVERQMEREARGGVPSTVEEPVQHQIVGEPPAPGVAGRVTAGKLIRAGGLAGAGTLGVSLGFKAFKALARGFEETERTGDELLFNRGVLNDIADASMLGSYLTYAIGREVALPGKQEILKSIEEKRTYSDVLGFKGIVPEIVLDPLTYIPYANIASLLGKGAKAIRLTDALAPVGQQVMRIAQRADEVAVLRRAIDTWEFTLGLPTIRPTTRRGLEVWERLDDKAIIEASQIRAQAELLIREIRQHGTQVDIDVGRVIDAGLTHGGRPPANRTLLGLAKKKMLAVIERESGAAHRDVVSKLYKQTADFQDSLGRELVTVEMLASQTAERWRRLHLKRIFRSFEDAEAYIHTLEPTDPKKARDLLSKLEWIKGHVKRPSGALNFQAIIRRKEIPRELRELLQEIPQATARLAAGTPTSADLISRGRMYQRLAEDVAIDTAVRNALPLSEARRYMLVPNDVNPVTGKKLFGALAGKHVPESIFYELTHSVPAVQAPALAWLDKNTRLLVRGWKIGKVPLSIPTQMRNVITNFWLADVVGDTAPYRLDRYVQSLISLFRKDDVYKEASQAGTFLHDTFASQELRDTVETAVRNGDQPLDLLRRAVGYLPKKAGDLYQFNEQWFKMTVYINTRAKGVAPELAADFADRALFNYRKLPRALNAMRRYGIFPFVAFPYKAIPAMARGFWSNTGRFARYPKLIRAIEAMTPETIRERERPLMPDWMKETHVRLPGEESRYLDIGYLIPYQDMQDVTGLALPAILQRLIPLATNIYEIAANKSLFTGRELVPDEESLAKLRPGEVRREKLKHFARFALPSMTPPVGSAWEGMFAKRGKPKAPLYREGEERPIGERVGYAFGLKTRKLDRRMGVLSRAFEIRDLLTTYARERRKIFKGRPESALSLRELVELEKLNKEKIEQVDILLDELRRSKNPQPGDVELLQRMQAQ